MSGSLTLRLLLNLAIALLFYCTKLAAGNHGLSQSHPFTFLGFCCWTLQHSARSHEDPWSGTWSSAPVPGSNPGQEKPWQAAKALVPIQMGPQASTPLPHVSTGKCLSSSLWSHACSEGSPLPLGHTHTHTHTHVIPHPLTSPFPAPSSSTDITGLRRKKYSFSSLKESLYFLQIRDRESLYHYHSLCITDPLLPTVSSSSDRKHTPCVSTDKIFTKTQSFSYKKPDKHLKQWHKPLFQG